MIHLGITKMCELFIKSANLKKKKKNNATFVTFHVTNKNMYTDVWSKAIDGRLIMTGETGLVCKPCVRMCIYRGGAIVTYQQSGSCVKSPFMAFDSRA